MKNEKDFWSNTKLESGLSDFFVDTIFILGVTIFSSVSIGFAYNIKT